MSDTPPETSAAPVPPPDALDHDGDGRKGGAITKAQAAALVWVVHPGRGLHRLPKGEALEATKDGETRLATPRDLAIAGIEQED